MQTCVCQGLVFAANCSSRSLRDLNVLGCIMCVMGCLVCAHIATEYGFKNKPSQDGTQIRIPLRWGYRQEVIWMVLRDPRRSRRTVQGTCRKSRLQSQPHLII